MSDEERYIYFGGNKCEIKRYFMLGDKRYEIESCDDKKYYFSECVDPPPFYDSCEKEYITGEWLNYYPQQKWITEDWKMMMFGTDSVAWHNRRQEIYKESAERAAKLAAEEDARIAAADAAAEKAKAEKEKLTEILTRSQTVAAEALTDIERSRRRRFSLPAPGFFCRLRSTIELALCWLYDEFHSGK